MSENEGLSCAVCGNFNIDFYIARPEIWKAAGLKEGLCCLECLVKRLGRELTISDFDMKAPINRLLIFGYRLGRQASETEDIPVVPAWPPKHK